MKAALYLRVSTGEQTTENQRLELESVAKARGWQIVQVFADEGISGAKSREKRPGLNALYRAATRREIDVVLAWSVDRISRSLRDLIDFMMQLHSLDVQLYLHQQALDTTTPTGKLMFQLTGAFAEYEREIIRARIRTGLARAKASGRRLGRLRVVDEALANKMRDMRESGLSVAAIAKATGLAERTVYRATRLKKSSWE